MTRWEKVLLGIFFFWLACGMICQGLRLEAAQVAGWNVPLWLRNFVGGCLRWGDPILIGLAAANVHGAAVRAWGAFAARKFAVGAMLLVGAIEWIGAATGYPFGPYVYTDVLGPRIGLLPLAIPLSWYLVTAAALLTVQLLPVSWNRWQEAGAAAVLATAYDWVMEPFAVKIKSYWWWATPEIPWQNYVSWWAVSFVICAALAPDNTALRHGRDWRPAVILGGILAFFSVARWIHGV
jgi:uncharacterized membrane protein